MRRTGGVFPLASRIALRSVTDGVWRGRVSPLADTRSLYTVIREEADGSLSAFIRSPESDLFARTVLRVSVRDSSVELTSAEDTADHLAGTYHESSGQLTLSVPIVNFGRLRFLGTFDFTRRDSLSAPGFFPRTPPNGPYVYHVPITEPDGWTTGSLASVGMDGGPIHAAMDSLLRVRAVDDSTANLQAILVARHGRLVLEEYFDGFDSDRPHDLRSAGKSFTTALVGIAIDHDSRLRTSTSVLSLFPGAGSLPNPDPRKNRVSVRDLLTMTSGLACDDGDLRSPGNEEHLIGQDSQPDFFRFMLDLPMVRDPGGTRAVYCSGGMHLLAGVVREATGTSARDFFERAVARPLDFGRYYLNLSPRRDYYGAGGLYLRPRDALKLGQLYLDGGVWRGRRIVSRRWIDSSTVRQSGFSPEHGYGFGWHVFTLRFAHATYRDYEAEGNGGQVIVVVPALDLPMTFTTGNYGYDMTVPERWFQAAVVDAIVGRGVHQAVPRGSNRAWKGRPVASRALYERHAGTRGSRPIEESQDDDAHVWVVNTGMPARSRIPDR